MALRRSKENQRANMRSSGSSVMMFAMVPNWTSLTSYSSKMGIGTAPSRKIRGRMVIFSGSERNFRQEERERAGKRERRRFLLVTFARKG